jgi:hypothetical protein
MKALKIDQNSVRRINIKETSNGDIDLADLQSRVGGYIEPFNMLFENVTLYVNEDGMHQCEPNRLIVATQYMADNLHIEPLSPVTVLYGNILAVGHDPKTGDDRSLTEDETKLVRGYFHELANPGSGVQALPR